MNNTRSMKIRALEKLDREIVKDIADLIEKCRHATLLELFYLMQLLHLARLGNVYPEEINHQKPELVRLSLSQIEETLKYLVQCVVKFGNEEILVEKETGRPVLNKDLVRMLVQAGNIINAKYETRALVQLFDVEVSGERDRYLKIDTSKAKSEPDVIRLFEYFVRIDLDNRIKLRSKKQYEDLLVAFKQEHISHSDLFQTEFGLSLETFLDFYRHILDLVIQRIQSSESEFPYLPNGNVDVHHQKFFRLYTLATSISVDSIQAKFGDEILPLIRRLTFNPSQFDESQLRYHQITRSPLVRLSEHHLQICPELMLDSLFINIHYSLLESKKSIKEEFKARSAEEFVSKIVAVCSQFGYVEVCRELELRENNRDLGDVDLVMKNSQNHFLLVEAKNHALPLDIYFKNVEATKQHLAYLRQHWEKPISIRSAHLDRRAANYGISKPFEYIVVSRYPEILSHYSGRLVLSIQELEQWLQIHPKPIQFSELYDHLYGTLEPHSIQDWEELRQQGYLVGSLLPPGNVVSV